MQVYTYRESVGYGVPVRRFLMSDTHLGTIHTDLNRLHQELSDAKKLGCRIMINGDIFDSVVATDRKRYEPGQMLPEFESASDHVAACCKHGLDVFGPYVENIDIIGCGNHETAFQKHNNANPARHLITTLNLLLAERKSSHRIVYGGYEGWVLTQLVAKSGDSARVFTHRLYYHHGAGGSAPVTKGQIDKSRLNEDVDADCITFGHKHQSTRTDIIRRGVSSRGGTFNRHVLFIQTGSYFRNHSQRNQEDADKISYAAKARHGNKPFGGRVLTLMLKCAGDGTVIKQWDHAADLPMGVA